MRIFDALATMRTASPAAAASRCGGSGSSADDHEGEDVRYASVGRLSLAYWLNRPLRRLTVLNIV
ncbi:hypothetical protein ACIGQE_20270 [Streptomyces sp. NPDC053429]|uniref:hypothetical protein n=1 Tax=Streptomyces sp. NPDC053429 TaxID=3365702 RepID=UPI0037D89657